MTKKNQYSNLQKVFVGMIDILLYHLSIYFSFYIRYEGNLPYNYTAYTDSWMAIMVIFVGLNILYGVYTLYNKSKVDLLYLTVIVQLIMTFSIMAVSFFGRWFSFPRSTIFISFLISTLVLFSWRMLVFLAYEKMRGTKKIMVVGTKGACESAILNFSQAKNRRHQIAMAAIDNHYEHVKNHFKEIDIVYLASDLKETEKRKIYDLLIKNSKKVFLNVSFENLIMVNPHIMNINDETVIDISDFQIRPEKAKVKRVMDIIFSLFLVIFTAPVMILAALLIKITSEGPVLYKQVRITKNRKEFNIMKFRTMSISAEKESGPVLSAANDSRVTTVGKYLRFSRVDELPQLINVLKGEMSIVGPRPERPFFVEKFEKQNFYYYIRHNVRAGITGYAQVNGKYATGFDKKLNFDLVYIKNYSLTMDVKILLQTVKVLFDKFSSKGVEEENQTWKQKVLSDVQVLS